ncbi:MAG: heavy metal translocating P-type ATPase [Candidatus Saccharimonadales bacterium]
MKKIKHFFKEYKQLGIVIAAVVIGAILDLTSYHRVAHWVLGTTAIINAIILLWGMLQDLRDGSYGIDILAATAIITSVALREYWAGIVIVLMLTGGEALEDYAERRAKTELGALLAHRPKLAHVIRGRKTIDVNVKDVQVGDKLNILPGEVVPVDCIVLEGSSSFDESSLTGESLPIEKSIGETILSGSVNVEGSLLVRATQTAGDSQYQQIIKLVKSAASSQSPFVRLADRYSIPFTIMAFAIAGTTWFITGHAIRFLEVIVVATPCPLLLGAPIALISGMSRAAKNGIIIKTGSAIERLAEIQTIAFDKTGTLTMGKPVVDTVQTYSTYSEKEVLAFAAGLEQSSNHILAKAIITAAHQRNVTIPKSKQITEAAGNGLTGHLQGKTIQLGRYESLTANKVVLPKNFKPEANTKTATFIAIDGVLAGKISFVDELRPESKSTLQRLTKAGIRHTLIVTGDSNAVAQQIAKKLGITDVRADCLPVDKLHAIEQIKDGPVAFVGDGVNDAPVLTAADVGIALGARGSTAASESADVVILLDDISKVADGVEIAKRTFFIAKQSILVGIFISIGLMGVFATGKFKPVYGAAIQELVDVTVIINALRAHGPFRAVKNLSK